MSLKRQNVSADRQKKKKKKKSKKSISLDYLFVIIERTFSSTL